MYPKCFFLFEFSQCWIVQELNWISIGQKWSEMKAKMSYARPAHLKRVKKAKILEGVKIVRESLESAVIWRQRAEIGV